jgi:hypothetical protein
MSQSEWGLQRSQDLPLFPGSPSEVRVSDASRVFIPARGLAGVLFFNVDRDNSPATELGWPDARGAVSCRVVSCRAKEFKTKKKGLALDSRDGWMVRDKTRRRWREEGCRYLSVPCACVPT